MSTRPRPWRFTAVCWRPQGGEPTQGYLTSVRGLNLHVVRLDDLVGPLRVTAERLSGDARIILYQFQMHHGDRCLLDGRASVVLDAQAL